MTERATATPFDPACRRCPRLAGFLDDCRAKRAGYFAAPVPAFGAESPRLLVVGLAPGMHGANRTGRPFTGDYAGELLYRTLYDAGFSDRPVSVSADDGLRLREARITNAVRCVPPANKPTPAEIRSCNAFLAHELATLDRVRVVLALGRIAHDAVLDALQLKRSSAVFGHAREHALPDGRILLDSYHCSRYNTQTRRLTPEMFRGVLARARELL
jgi:uracil-DNA glycosylase family 4